MLILIAVSSGVQTKNIQVVVPLPPIRSKLKHKMGMLTHTQRQPPIIRFWAALSRQFFFLLVFVIVELFRCVKDYDGLVLLSLVVFS